MLFWVPRLWGLCLVGNGAPDVFASVAAVRGGQYRTGFGAILSAGTFVSAFVVGFVAIYAAPFSLNPVTFVRDVLFYLVAALFLFYVYLSAEIFLWQAVGFVGFYVFFVGIVFWMDFGLGGGRRKVGAEVGLVGEALHFMIEKEPPKTEQIPVLLIAFVMSVFWISTIAGELLNCLEALGSLLELPPALLRLTVLAWGNSAGDLVADVAVAKAGQPAMAMAGCFAGPMFNVLVWLGTAYELHFHLGIVTAFVVLLLSLMGSLLVIIWYRFRVPRFWGFCLVGLYILFMAISLIIAKFSG
ncbi:hypothetical protein CMV_028123 [Castanea mollissima]|uniref:Sodium/calcium exchanger membrane region domain-containing protein n=1 Tax=Castanea mollissima TaxID=60419 RepID=A0A8J4VEL4_9ROSI|nr:hypothetical protein CMV_028123 [Castanea mollissima]